MTDATDNPFDGHQLRSPQLSEQTAQELLRDRYGRSGRLTPLGSHQDQNFRVDCEDGQFVLKISNPGFTRGGLDAQNAAMSHIAHQDAGLRVPLPVADGDGQLVCVVDDDRRYDVRLVTYLDGQPLSDAGYLSPSALRAHGALAARAALALTTFDHPGLDRLLQWDCRHALDVVRALGPHDPDPVRQQQLHDLTEDSDRFVRALGDALREHVVHADVTDVNVVCTRNRAGQLIPDGLIDFGDIARTWLVSDVAVAAVSAVLHDMDRPLQTAGHVLAGYHGTFPITDAEISALWPLVIMRAALCAVSSEQQAQLEPHNDYAVESQRGDWLVWEAVTQVPSALAEAHLRRAVGLDPAPPRFSRAAQSLARTPPRTVLDAMRDRPVVALDLSTTSDVLVHGGWEDGERVAQLVAAAAVSGVPVARHAEGRLVDGPRDSPKEPDSVHLGADVFAQPGTPVVSPVDGTVRATTARLLVIQGNDYDVVLRGVSPEVAAGTQLAAGAHIGVVAPDLEDVLPPHVHVQVVAVPGLLPPSRTVPSLAPDWLALCLDPRPFVGGVPSAPRPDPDELMTRRAAVFGEQQEHYYQQPPRIERGWRHHLYDTDGRCYLDAVNNVAVLGHSHPAVEAAVSRQLRLLNTNSRFNYESMVAFAERLSATLPDALDTVFLVSTGSEANDVAIRLVRAATGRRDVIALRSAYHGWTVATDEVSTSLADNPNAVHSRPEWVHPIESPNTFRGRFRGPDAADRYLEDLHRLLAELAAAGRGPAAFICEPLYGNAGGLPLPDGYLKGVYDAVRAAGGICIADEVQVGYGRLGRYFWAFEQQGVVPDVVTVAKATGNGVPVAAMVTTRALAEAFAAEGSFFSSVGGSPVASAAGLAVLDALEQEDLPGNAERVGSYLRGRLEQLVDEHALVGAVHGMGLYLGVELVRDRETLEPATEETAAICERMLELGIVVQPTSDHLNVLKVKPPLCLTQDSADFFVDSLQRVISDGW